MRRAPSARTTQHRPGRAPALSYTPLTRGGRPAAHRCGGRRGGRPAAHVLCTGCQLLLRRAPRAATVPASVGGHSFSSPLALRGPTLAARRYGRE